MSISIGFAGADYSGRANKIAHHFMLSPSEQLAQGPAWMMAKMSKEIFCSQWHEQPCELSAKSLNQLLSTENAVTGSSLNWQNLSGDAGWGGMLVKAFYDNSKVPAYVIYEPGTDLLPLFVESMSLMPMEDRWSVGFSTYYTTLPAGCFYHWRGVVAGYRLFREIARFPNAVVIDLQIFARAEIKNTQAARTGIAYRANVLYASTDIEKRIHQSWTIRHDEARNDSNLGLGGRNFFFFFLLYELWLKVTAWVLAIMVVSFWQCQLSFL